MYCSWIGKICKFVTVINFLNNKILQKRIAYLYFQSRQNFFIYKRHQPSYRLMPLYFVCDQHLSRCPHLDQISIRIIEPDNLLPPAVYHQFVYILDPRIQPFQFFHERIHNVFLNIKLCRITPQNHFFFQKTFPNISVLKDKSLCQNHIATIIQHYIQFKQIVVNTRFYFNPVYVKNSRLTSNGIFCYISDKASPSFQKRMTEIFRLVYSCSNQSAIS